MQLLQICIGPIIRIGRESWCLPYAGFLYTTKISTEINLQKRQKSCQERLRLRKILIILRNRKKRPSKAKLQKLFSYQNCAQVGLHFAQTTTILREYWWKVHTLFQV